MVYTVCSGTTNLPDPNNRPNGPNVAPVDAVSSESVTYDAADTLQQDHRPPHRGTAFQSGLPQVRVKSCFHRLQVPC